MHVVFMCMCAHAFVFVCVCVHVCMYVWYFVDKTEVHDVHIVETPCMLCWCGKPSEPKLLVRIML